MNMGIEPFLVATSRAPDLAQRLVRRVCKECKEPMQSAGQALIEAGFAPGGSRASSSTRAGAAASCNNTGYKGRVGLYEVMEI